jgi:dethiobiotin synthetase
VRGVFVTGTGTGVGKTILSAALLAAMRAAGEKVAAHKPVVTGLCDPADLWPADHELLATAAGTGPEAVTSWRLQSASSPHLAAKLEGVELEREALVEQARLAGANADVVVVEGVGGLLVPLTDDFCVLDLAVELGLGLLIAASPGLGTINHTLLTLRAARTAGLRVQAVVLTPWPERSSALERSNLETIERLGEVSVQCLAEIAGPDPRLLAQAGERLPWRDWL